MFRFPGSYIIYMVDKVGAETEITGRERWHEPLTKYLGCTEYQGSVTSVHLSSKVSCFHLKQASKQGKD